MTSLVHHVPRRGHQSTGATGRDLVVVRASAHLRSTAVTLVVVACLLAGAVLTTAAIANIDTHGRTPHPVPLPAPTGQSLAGS